MTRHIVMLATAVALALPAAGSAQVPWESPFLMGPNMADGLGIHLVDYEAGPGSGIGVLFTWREQPVPQGLGFRAGVAEGIDGDVAGFAGVDVSGYLIRQSDEFPMDFVWASGLGLGAGDYVLVSAPLGVSLGRSFESEGVSFTPYVGPRLTLDAHLGLPSDVDDDDLELAFSLDLGADIAFSENLAIRFGASLADHEALSIGLVFPGM